MIRSVMVMNTQGKPRLAKFYDFQIEFHSLISDCREATGAYPQRFWRAENVSNFLDAASIFGPDSSLVYKHYATLYFVLVFDSSENELAMLDLIQVFVETLDKCFKNVCELDIVFNYSKIHTILDEMIFGGQVLETSSTELVKAVEEISRLESASNSITLVPKSVSGWRNR
ncbi:AP-3 complex subunit sigma isoform X2 [Castanea sativa]|uniref:AP-3 complex subunit sigma isoform X2 n=1 Tax=Quercus lobata TaxID=97700 RepID=UPI001245D11C|nr:AP-3 complex subunit sigma isoform X2 [Quercus lobata]XP_050291411.1 AP-3 complex subunit sigma isoform X2 [Quercus robur]